MDAKKELRIFFSKGVKNSEIMNIFSLNVIGSASIVKRMRINSLIKLGKPNFILLQETKRSFVDDKFVCSLLSQEEVLLSCSYTSGESGGLLSIWKSSDFQPVFSFSGYEFLGVKVI